jgi:hypothetical protein
VTDNRSGANQIFDGGPQTSIMPALTRWYDADPLALSL